METGQEETTRRAVVRKRRELALPVLWAVLLCASIASAGLKALPATAGRGVLGLIGGGFLLFTIARASMEAVASAPSSCAHLLPRPMRRLYWAGYALMVGGVVLAAAAAAGVLLG